MVKSLREKRKEDRKNKALTIFMLVILTVSTIFFGLAIFGGGFGGDDSSSEESEEFERVVERDISESEESSLKQNGLTVMKYYYPNNCSECQDKISFIRNMKDEHQDLFVSLVVGSDERVYVSSNQGTETTNQTNEDSIVDAYCSVTPYSWDRCVIRNV